MTRPSDEQLGRLVRKAAWAAASRTATTGAARDQAVLAHIEVNHPRGIGLFGAPAILALLRQPEGGACAWDAYRVLSDGPLPAPTPALHALLGAQCRRCKVRFAAQEVAERESAHIAAITAAGLKPEAASRVRDPGFARQLAVEIETLRRAGSAPASALTVRDAIQLARRRQQAREDAYTAASAARGVGAR